MINQKVFYTFLIILKSKAFYDKINGLKNIIISFLTLQIIYLII